METAFDFVFTSILVLVPAAGAILLLLTIYATLFDSGGPPPDLRDCTAVFVVMILAGFATWTLLAYWLPELASQQPPIALKLATIGVGILGGIVTGCSVGEQTATAPNDPKIIPPSRALVTIDANDPDRLAPDKSEAEVTSRLPSTAVRSAMDDAFDIRDPVSAFTNRVGTNAQIKALHDAARLANAATVTAAAQARGIDAMISRDEKLTELRARQQFDQTLFEEKLAEQRERLAEAEHQRLLATKRREKEGHLAERQTVSAKNGVAAEKRFKNIKFELGEERARARIADVSVDRATADAAISELGATPRGKTAKHQSVAELIESLRERIADAEARGVDSTFLRTALRSLEQQHATN